MEWYSSVLSFFLILRILPSVFRRVVEKTNCGGTCRPLAVRKCFGRHDFVGHSSVAVAEVIYRLKVLPSLRCFVFYFLQQSVTFVSFLFRILEYRLHLTPCLVVEESGNCVSGMADVGAWKNLSLFVLCCLNPSFLVNICLLSLSISND